MCVVAGCCCVPVLTWAIETNLCCSELLLRTCALFLWLIQVVPKLYVSYLCVVSVAVVGCCHAPVVFVVITYLCIVAGCCSQQIQLFVWLLRVVAGCCYIPVGCYVLLRVVATYLCVVSAGSSQVWHR